jgi:hypothetical protein
MTQFTVSEIIELMQYSNWVMEYFMPLQDEVTERINAKLRGENVDADMTSYDQSIYNRCIEKITADARETRHIAKYAHIFPHPSDRQEVGAILVSSWGYDQTNVDFYVIVERSAAMLKLLPLGKTNREEKTFMSGTCMPTAFIDFRAELLTRKAADWVKVSDCQLARLWDGKKQHESWYA